MPNNIPKLTKEWIIKSQNDFKSAQIYDLIHLLTLCKKIDNNFKSLENSVSFLNRYYVETRYPPEITIYSKAECKKAIGYAQKATQFVINKII